MKIEKKVRTKKKDKLCCHVQTSLTQMEYDAIDEMVLKHGESKTIRKAIQYAYNNGFLKTI